MQHRSRQDVFDSEDALRILADPDYIPVAYGARHHRLAERLGLDFSAILFAIAHIPLCQSGAVHQAARARLARLIGATKGQVETAIPEHVARHMAPLSVPGPTDVLGEVIGPLVSDVLSDLVGLPLGLEVDSLVSGVFSQSMGVAKRRRMEAELADILDRIRQITGGSEQEVGDRLALAILGRDALFGTLGVSLAAQINAAAGRPIGQVAWPELPPETGVPYIDRCPAAPDSTAPDVRLHLKTLEASEDPRARLKFFGSGLHTCLGRATSLALWTAMGQALAQNQRQVTVSAWCLRRDDVFQCPEQFEVVVT